MRRDVSAGEFAVSITGGKLSTVDLERVLWVAVGVSLVGDIVTTFVGLHLGLSEANPIALEAIESYGLVGMLALKGFAVGVALGCRGLLDAKCRPIVPACLAVPWTIAACLNLITISTVL